MAAYIAGYNMVGYMPEMEPHAFTDHEDAKQFLIGELNWIADQDDMAGDHDSAEELSNATQELNLVKETDSYHGEWSTIVGNTSFWLNYSHTMTAEDVEEYNNA